MGAGSVCRSGGAQVMRNRLRAGRAPFAMLLAVVCLGATVARAGPVASRLIPLDPQFAELGPMRGYYSTLRRQLLGSHPFGPHLIVTPSFAKEWAVQVAWDRGQPFAMSVKVKESLWYTLQGRMERERKSEAELLLKIETPLERVASPLTAETARAVEQAWDAMLATARIPEDPPRGIDGTGYWFFSTAADGARRAGYAWSPQPGTATRGLVDLADALKAHAEAPERSWTATEAEVAKLSKAVLRLAAP